MKRTKSTMYEVVRSFGDVATYGAFTADTPLFLLGSGWFAQYFAAPSVSKCASKLGEYITQCSIQISLHVRKKKAEMQVKNWSRIKGTSCLLAMVVSGLFTNCTCGHADPGDTTITHDYSQGDVQPVTVCADSVNFNHYVGDPSMCDGSATASPGAPTGWFLPTMDNMMRKCPDDGATSIPATQAFNIYWTITNISDGIPTDANVVQYNFDVYKLDGAGAEVLVKGWTLTQPKLSSCEFQDIGFGFNNGDANRALGAGTYRFRLTGIYDNTTTPPGWLATTPQEVVIR